MPVVDTNASTQLTWGNAPVSGRGGRPTPRAIPLSVKVRPVARQRADVELSFGQFVAFNLATTVAVLVIALNDVALAQFGQTVTSFVSSLLT